MVQDDRITVRLDAKTLRRLDVLIQRLMADPAMRARGQMKRAAVVRLALDYGLPILEEKYPPSKKWLS